MNDREFLITGAARLGLNLPAPTLDRLLTQALELERWNRKINLVAKAPFQQILENHFLDSLTLLPLLAEEDSGAGPLLDIGSGAGFPGLVLAVAAPDYRFVLAEPRLKRISFLKQIIRLLGLTNVEILAERLTPGGPRTLLDRGFRFITSRAFARVGDFLDLAAPFCLPGGRVVCMKGPKARAEAEEWRLTSPGSPFHPVDLREITLPFSGASRTLLVFQKAREEAKE